MLPQKPFAILRRPWRPVWLVILLVAIIMTLNGYPPPARAASPAEIASLTSIYNNLGGAGWTDSTNWLDSDPCDATPWYGVTCDGLGNVTRVDLPNNNSLVILTRLT